MRDHAGSRFVGSFLGGAASVFSVLASCCGIGCLSACAPVCAAPLASLLGFSSAAFLSSPVWKNLQPVLIAISAVSFTVAYCSLYKPGTKNGDCLGTACGCTDQAQARQGKRLRLAKAVFWISLIVSVGLFAYSLLSRDHQARDAGRPCGTGSECAGTPCATIAESSGGTPPPLCNMPCRGNKSRAAPNNQLEATR